MAPIDTIFHNARLAGGGTGSLAVSGGRIVALGPDLAEAPEAERIDLGGGLVTPGFVEGHIHLDKSWIGDRWRPHRPCTKGFDVHERVAFEKELLADAAPMAARAAALVELAVSKGTSYIRCHIDVDASVGLAHLEVLLEIREAYKDTVTMELVAFPQSGILACPGTAELMDEAIGQGADLVGGLDPASFDRDIERHLDVVFGIAERRGAGIDIHLHDAHMLCVFQLERIAERARALGMAGRVAVSHAYGLGDVPLDVAKKTGATLAEAGVAIMTNAPGSHAFPPILLLREAGVTVFSGSDNVRDSWWPYGDADMLSRAMILGYRSGFNTDEELAVAFDVVTQGGAKALSLESYGLVAGAPADFVVLDAEHIQEAVVGVPAGRSVYKNGRAVVRDGTFLGPEGPAAGA